MMIRFISSSLIFDQTACSTVSSLNQADDSKKAEDPGTSDDKSDNQPEVKDWKQKTESGEIKQEEQTGEETPEEPKSSDERTTDTPSTDKQENATTDDQEKTTTDNQEKTTDDQEKMTSEAPEPDSKNTSSSNSTNSSGKEEVKPVVIKRNVQATVTVVDAREPDSDHIKASREL